ncbi:MAG: glycosyltransferase, partial [Pseudomonadota bacterium]|nr:glycosyltransferase [Pseudomonadota bacterium]
MTNNQTPAGDYNHPKKLDQKQRGIKLSVIIPTLNAGSTLNQTIESLSSAKQRGVEIEIIVVDAGSTDDTEQLALEADAKFVTSDRGRGTQLHRGAQLASGDWFLFLHADTVLTSGWDASFVVFTSHPSNA